MAFATPPPPPPPPPPASSNWPSSPSPNGPSRPSTALPSRRRRSAIPALSLPFPPRSRTVFLADVRVIERKKLPAAVVERHLNPLVQKKVTLQQIADALSSINIWFVNEGYKASRLNIIQAPGWFQNTLVLYSIEPRLVALRLISVDKDGKPAPDVPIVTRERTICNIIGCQVGDIFRWNTAGFDALMSLGIFESARAELKFVDTEKVELHLHVKEQPNGRVEPGAGMTSDGRIYGDISVVDNNFLGRAQRLRVEWQRRLDAGRSAGGIAFEDMRIGARIPFSVRLRAYRDSNSGRSIPAAGAVSRAAGALGARTPTSAETADAQSQSTLNYEKDRDGAMIELGYKPLGKEIHFAVTPMLEFVHPTETISTSASSIPQVVLQSSCLHAANVQALLPRKGHVAHIEYSIGAHLSNTSDKFHRTSLRVAKYIGVGPLASIAIGGALGFGSQNLPWHEQKSLGGHGSVRGFEYGELGRLKSFRIGRIELRVPLTSPENTRDAGPGTDASQASEESGGGKGDMGKGPSGVTDVTDAKKGGVSLIPDGMLKNLPNLVGVLFGDIATAGSGSYEVLGKSYGLGLRIGGVITVDWTRTGDGRESRLHFGLVERFP